ncbi:MAG: cryptochrome/photolyase family protein [Sphingomonadaceae bacterium]|nr:cryptochrome/photolyase family protein [Sphingomonadaceae bacterium]
MTTLIPVFGDQLSEHLGSLRDVRRKDAVVLMVEVERPTRYHKKKLVLVYAAMRHFAAALIEAGWTVDYVKLDQGDNSRRYTAELTRAIERHKPERLRLVAPSEYGPAKAVECWQARFALPVEIMADDRFVVGREEFARWAQGRSSLTMEFFYREVRRATGLLMNGDAPAGGRWNYDHDNRKTPPKGLNFPAMPAFAPDAITREVIAMVGRRFADHFGDLEPFGLPVTRAQAMLALDAFIRVSLPRFGDYQDAMLAGQDLLYHSALSPALNLGLLSPVEVCEAAEAAYRSGEVPINCAEGFIRQIIGWREYVRGLYWLDMPGFREANRLGATRPLPGFYWTGDAPMHCLRECVGQVRREAYSHHIQRLMVLGNFALIAGVDPKQIDDWFWVAYADAYQWVELPNVIGMSQFADGGRLATKPYAASGAYIRKMSDYCDRCRFDVKQRVGPDACPYNVLYWDFLARNRAAIGDNPRLTNIYRAWDRKSEEEQAALRASAAAFLDTLEPATGGWVR